MNKGSPPSRRNPRTTTPGPMRTLLPPRPSCSPARPRSGWRAPTRQSGCRQCRSRRPRLPRLTVFRRYQGQRSMWTERLRVCCWPFFFFLLSAFMRGTRINGLIDVSFPRLCFVRSIFRREPPNLSCPHMMLPFNIAIFAIAVWGRAPRRDPNFIFWGWMLLQLRANEVCRRILALFMETGLYYVLR